MLLEAQSQRLPVVSTTVSAIPELIEHEGGGLLAPPGDVAALAEALQKLIRDPALRERMGSTGETRVRKNFAVEPGIEELAKRFGLPATAVKQGGGKQGGGKKARGKKAQARARSRK